MELFIVGVVGAIVSALLFREFGGRQKNATCSTLRNSELLHSTSDLPQNWVTDPAYCWMSGNVYYESRKTSSFSSQDDDWMTDPCYSYLPSNVFNHEESTSPCTCTGSDWITDPCCSYMPGNIYHHDDSTASACAFENDNWMTDPSCSYMSGNIFHDDDHFGPNSSGFSCDDTWSNSSNPFNND